MIKTERWDIPQYGYIYITTNIINGRKYIGKHKSEIFETWYKGSGAKILEDFQKIGKENFTVELIEWCYSLEELNEREKFWINYYNAREDYNFYNIYDSGNDGRQGYKTTPEFREQVRERKLATNKRKGKVFWVNNEIKEHLVNEKEYNDLLKEDNSYIIGRLPDMVYMYKDNKSIKIHSSEIDDYIQQGFVPGKDDNISKNISKSRQHSVWFYNNIEFPTSGTLTNYLRRHGYPEITYSTVVNICNGKLIKKYKNLCSSLKRVRLD